MSGLDPVELAAWVRSTCEAQGVPVKVTDPVALRRIGDLLGTVAGR